jgi:hypothetical protein
VPATPLFFRPAFSVLYDSSQVVLVHRQCLLRSSEAQQLVSEHFVLSTCQLHADLHNCMFTELAYHGYSWDADS